MALRLRAMLRFPRDHAYTKAHLSEYVDGDLDPGGTRRVDEHVGICPPCRRMLETLMQTISALGSLRPEPRPGLADGVIDRLRDDP
jgi:anti-sigma factor RsiW